MIVIMSVDFSVLFTDGQTHRYSPEESVFRTGDKVTRVFWVRRGSVTLIRTLASGQQITLHKASANSLVAEASVYADSYHCDCVVSGETELLSIPRDAFKTRLQSDVQLAEAWAASLARGIQAARMRAEIRSLKTVADRLDAWFADNAELPTKGQWQQLAEELSVSREALYRELAKRRV